MKQILKCSSFYHDIDNLSNLISNLEFEENLYGKEIKDFQYIPEGISEFVNMVLQEDVEIQPDTGTFRKPSSVIYFDNFYEHALWTCIVALEDTKINIHSHKDGHETFFDVKEGVEQFFLDNAFKHENWATNTTLSLKKNDFMFVRPWVWKSLQEGQLIQTFLLNKKLG